MSSDMKVGALTVLAMFTMIYVAAIGEWHPGFIVGIAGYVFGFLALGTAILLARRAIVAFLA